jgi:aspartyl-tRNA(Asn)/glutamyl-tRNA(Gln) amidotransferase subunit A
MSYTVPTGFETYFKEWEDKIGAFIEYGRSSDSGRDSGSATAPAAAPVAAPVATATDAAAALKGLPFAVKDNISVEGFHVSCGSTLLAGVKAPYTATAAAKLLAAGCVPVGKTNLDEFGMGSSTDNSALKQTNNPWDFTRVPGGSSGGSAAAVASGLVPFALGSDTGGSIRQPAAFCGVVGLKPSYGAVSRYGLVAYASSLEGIGVLSDTVARSRDVFALMRGADPLDQTSRDAPAGSPALYGGKPGAGVIGVLKTGEDLEAETRKGFEAAKKGLEDLGYTLKEIDIPSLKYVTPAYYTIATAEASANLARFDGVRYGKRPDWAENPDDLIDKTREAGFGPEVKLRILLGTFVLRSGFQDRYYLRAQRIRAGIKSHFENLLGDSEYAGKSGAYDAILMPVFPTRAFGRGDSSLSPFAQKAADLYTCCANLAGLPALSFPASVEGGLPVGVQLVGRAFAEASLLDIAEAYEKKYPFPHPAGYRSFWSK